MLTRSAPFSRESSVQLDAQRLIFYVSSRTDPAALAVKYRTLSVHSHVARSTKPVTTKAVAGCCVLEADGKRDLVAVTITIVYRYHREARRDADAASQVTGKFG